MNSLVTYLHGEFQLLSVESNKKQLDIKDTIDRVFKSLTLFKDSMNKQQQLSSKDLSKLDIVQPLLLAASQIKITKMVTIATGCLQRLITHKALIDDAIVGRILQVFVQIMNTNADIQLRVLQSLLPMLSNYPSIHQNDLYLMFYICFQLNESKVSMINNSASATLRQIVIYIFDRMEKTDSFDDLNQSLDISKESTILNTKDALIIFKDLCNLIQGNRMSIISPTFIPTSSSSLFAIELVESIVGTHPESFRSRSEFLELLRDPLCNNCIKQFKSSHDYSHSLRLFRIFGLMIREFSSDLPEECHLILKMIIKVLDISNRIWQRVLALEVLRGIFQSFYMVLIVYEYKHNSINILSDFFTYLDDILAQYQHDHPNTRPDAASNILSINMPMMKIPWIDQLERPEPPMFHSHYPLLIGFQCLIAIIRGCYDHVMSDVHPLPQNIDSNATINIIYPSKEKQVKYESIASLLTDLYPKFYSMIFSLYKIPMDDNSYGSLLYVMKELMYITTILDLVSIRDSILIQWCKVIASVKYTNDSSISESEINMMKLSSSTLFNTVYAIHKGMNNEQIWTYPLELFILLSNSKENTSLLSDITIMEKHYFYTMLISMKNIHKYVVTGSTSNLALLKGPNIDPMIVSQVLRDIIMLNIFRFDPKHPLYDEKLTEIIEYLVNITENCEIDIFSLIIKEWILGYLKQCHVSESSQSNIIDWLHKIAIDHDINTTLEHKIIDLLLAILQEHNWTVGWKNILDILKHLHDKRIGYQCLQWIASSDILGLLHEEQLIIDCIDTLWMFILDKTIKEHDINTSLGCIALLWNVSDEIARRKRDKNDSDSSQRMRMHLLIQLVHVTRQSNDRKEIQASAIQTLFRTLTLQNMVDDEWNQVINQVICSLLLSGFIPEQLDIMSSDTSSIEQNILFTMNGIFDLMKEFNIQSINDSLWEIFCDISRLCIIHGTIKMRTSLLDGLINITSSNTQKLNNITWSLWINIVDSIPSYCGGNVENVSYYSQECLAMLFELCKIISCDDPDNMIAGWMKCLTAYLPIKEIVHDQDAPTKLQSCIIQEMNKLKVIGKIFQAKCQLIKTVLGSKEQEGKLERPTLIGLCKNVILSSLGKDIDMYCSIEPMIMYCGEYRVSRSMLEIATLLLNVKDPSYIQLIIELIISGIDGLFSHLDECIIKLNIDQVNTIYRESIIDIARIVLGDEKKHSICIARLYPSKERLDIMQRYCKWLNEKIPYYFLYYDSNSYIQEYYNLVLDYWIPYWISSKQISYERLGYTLWDGIFDILSKDHRYNMTNESRKILATKCLDPFIKHCSKVIQKYIEEKKSHGKFPLPRSQQDEMTYLLSRLNSLSIIAENERDSVVHLYKLYSNFIKCIDIHDDLVSGLIVLILERIGRSLDMC